MNEGVPHVSRFSRRGVFPEVWRPTSPVTSPSETRHRSLPPPPPNLLPCLGASNATTGRETSISSPSVVIVESLCWVPPPVATCASEFLEAGGPRKLGCPIQSRSVRLSGVTTCARFTRMNGRLLSLRLELKITRSLARIFRRCWGPRYPTHFAKNANEWGTHAPALCGPPAQGHAVF